ncbi:class I SAM-dependent methyltransferase [Nocardiopsis rhodophaea]|uniref:class I SAM-dependent methyltransferase n=1 Tax=Nocardiopsis rhodophaea TaxID=280238 RepID=UPI0031DD2778
MDHYLSSGRRDPIKVQAEEPFTRRILRDVIDNLHRPIGGTIRMIDMGCGTGDGLALLSNTSDGEIELRSLYNIFYHGLDSDPSMINAARALNTNVRASTFSVGDMRDCGRADFDDYDLYLSFGVPWSHLTPREAQDLLANLFIKTRRSSLRTALVVDVLGRYSIEWVKQWPYAQWDYSMSFMNSAEDVVHAPMSFYSRDTLSDLIDGASQQSGTKPARVDFHDRSIMTGRHTSTGTFNNTLPPYRNYINQLLSGRTDVDLDNLYFTPPQEDCPPEVQTFFASFASSWNERITRANETSGQVDEDELKARNLALGKQLVALEQRSQRGLGVGHSFTATIYLD